MYKLVRNTLNVNNYSAGGTGNKDERNYNFQGGITNLYRRSAANQVKHASVSADTSSSRGCFSILHKSNFLTSKFEHDIILSAISKPSSSLSKIECMSPSCKQIRQIMFHSIENSIRCGIECVEFQAAIVVFLSNW